MNIKLEILIYLYLYLSLLFILNYDISNIILIIDC